MRFSFRIIIKFFICLLIALIRVGTQNDDVIVVDSPASTTAPVTMKTVILDDSNDKNLSNSKYPVVKNPCYTNKCSDLSVDCLSCTLNYTCIYGEPLNATCSVKPNSVCEDKEKELIKSYVCNFCYQLPPDNYSCTIQAPCQLYHRTLVHCRVHDNVLCLGHRKFSKYIRCNYRSGKKWSTALLLSITLGGFGVDRFYLGNWQEGIGKLFSFGGLGIWTLIDVILIATGYLKPNDGNYI